MGQVIYLMVLERLLCWGGTVGVGREVWSGVAVGPRYILGESVGVDGRLHGKWLHISGFVKRRDMQDEC